MTDNRRPVVVRVNSECGHASGAHTDYDEIDRDRWDAMTPAERVKECHQMAADLAAQHFGYGWSIPDDADMKMTEENNDV